jgi:hypothetical protein
LGFGAYPARERPLKVLLDSLFLVEVQVAFHKLKVVHGIMDPIITVFLAA